MGFLDKFKSKATDAAAEHPDKVEEGVEKAGDFVDEKTGGEHSEQIDAAQEKVEEGLGVGSEESTDSTDGSESEQGGSA